VFAKSPDLFHLYNRNVKQLEGNMSDSETPTNAPKKRGCVFWGIIIVVVLVILAVLFGPSKEEVAQQKAVSAKQEASDAQAERASAIKVTARDLSREMKANEIAALKKYEGQLIEVSGTIKSIDADFSDDPVLQLDSGEMFEFVAVNLGSGQTYYAAKLQKGQKVVMLCKALREAIGSAQLSDCTPAE
jgi:tRNA_anti-like